MRSNLFFIFLFSFSIFYSENIFSKNISQEKNSKKYFFENNYGFQMPETGFKSKTRSLTFNIQNDTLPKQINLSEIEIKSIRIVNGTRHLNDVAGEVIYAGKKMK